MNFTELIRKSIEIVQLYGKNATSGDGTQFEGVARLAEKSGVVVLVSPLVVGVLTTLINSVQLWTLKTKFRRELNSLFVILRHLCVADLLNGVVTLSQTLLSVIEWKLLPANTILLWLTEFVGLTCVKYVYSVSTVLLNCLTLLKMIIITRNCWYTRALVRKICKCVWSLTFVIVTIGYAISKTEVISSEGQVIFRRIWIPLCTLLSLIFQCYGLGKIFYRTRRVKSRISRSARAARAARAVRPVRRTQSDGNFLKIAIFQIMSYMVCVTPLSIYLALPLLCDFKVRRHLHALFGVLAYLNSIIDPIVFFVVYRHKLRRPRQFPPPAPVQEIELAYVVSASNC